MTTKDYIYNVAVATTATGFFLTCAGVFNPSWWVLKDADARVVDVFDLFGNIQCFDRYCVAAYISVSPGAAQHEDSVTPAWLVIVRFLCILNFLTLLVALVIQITHLAFTHQRLLLVVIGFLIASMVYSTITAGVVIHKIKLTSSYHYHPLDNVIVRMQTHPLVIILLSTPFCTASLAFIAYAVSSPKQNFHPLGN